MKLTKKGEAGQILILVLLLLALGPLLVVPMLRLSYSSQRYNQVTDIITLNSYAADSGVEYAKYQIYNDPGQILITPLLENLVIGGVDVNVTAVYNPVAGSYDITSTAARAGRAVTLDVTIVIDVGLFGNAVATDGDLVINNCYFSVSGNLTGEADVYTKGSITIQGNSTIYGDVNATEDVDIKNNSYVDDDVNAGGTVTIEDGSEVAGDVNSGAVVGVITFPTIDPQVHEDKAKATNDIRGSVSWSGSTRYLGPTFIDGDLDVSGNGELVLGGTVYFTGDVDINNTDVTGFGDIIAEGTLVMNNYSLTVTNPEYLPLFMSVNKTITFNNDYEAGTFAIVYAPHDSDGEINLTNVELTGSVASTKITLDNSTIYYPAELRGRADLPGAGLDTVTYIFE